ncbi:MAG: glycosyltransferase family 4 protein [Paraglaciecola sp.]|uniref:Glycosyltransferase family 4 protein n=1 Tax=Rheinheimera baltica TaxID=67576 RepID=A0ABT9HUZ4_9GAMM|nr:MULTISPECIES: glycosyltransferase family 4 protein [Gammaproteobacteria]MDP5031272.1 glycosyltransferase family 4 protein [Paraglaciecola sp.]MDP5133185.1 glycosyltransferase family 4 protein [Paraglaciecola sp.]MDP5134944.1 glycosyltransferase family 4 protein [Rheinheimera baltica]MDP5149805.1 glycosyltransferase family 4 protein [Rheinheimera baltica]
MKIIYLHQYFTTPDMSGGTRSYEMAKRLVNAGHEVHIITSWREPTDHTSWFYQNIDGINIHWLPVIYSNKMSFNRRIKAFFHYAVKAAAKAVAIQGDVVFATSTPLTIALPGVYASKRLNVPMIFEVRDLWPELPIAVGAIRNPAVKWLAKMLERFAYKHSAHIIALSPGMAEGIVNTGVSSSNVTVIPNSADLELFDPATSNAHMFRNAHAELGESPIVLYAGTLGLINGVSYLADLAKECLLLKSDVKFVVIGDGMEWSQIKQYAGDLGVLDHNFFMYPPMPKKQLVNAFKAASISTSLFVDLVQMQANSANKFFDALSSGTPVAVNYGGWQAALLKENVAGFQLTRDTKQAAELIVSQLKNEDHLKLMGDNALNLAQQRFSRDKLAKEFENVFCSVIKQGGKY